MTDREQYIPGPASGAQVRKDRGQNRSRLGPLAVFVPALQFFTGLNLFVLPYATKWGSGRRTD